MNSYEEKKQARIDRLNAAAEKAEKNGRATGERAMKRLEGIPPGQPILVGHHSEKRHRAVLDRHDRDMRKSIEEGEKAKYYRQRAEAAESNNSISSDDPEAIVKLKEKLADREKMQETMKVVNRAYVKVGRPVAEPGDKEKWEKFRELVEGKITQNSLSRILTQVVGEGVCRAWNKPFPSYALSNNNANIKRIRDRIKQLEAQADAVYVGRKYETSIGELVYVEDPAENRVQLHFEGKPELGVRKQLKQAGFRWSPTFTAWQRHLNSAGRWAAKRIIDALGGKLKS